MVGDRFVSIVIPVYNEGTEVGKTVAKIKEAVDFPHEIITVNDGSTDNTGEVLRSIKGIVLVEHSTNSGYGAALKTGINKAKGDWILITDADGTYPLDSILDLVKYKDRYDMVVGARKGSNVNIPLLRRPAKAFLNNFASYVSGFKIPDLNSGFRLFKKDLAYKYWNLLPEGFSFTSTITVASLTNGYSVGYLNVDYYPRKGKSHISPIKDFLGFSKLLMKLALFFNPLKVFVPLSVFLFLCSLLLVGFGFYYGAFYDTAIMIFASSGLQIFVLGLIAELIVRTRHSV